MGFEQRCLTVLRRLRGRPNRDQRCDGSKTSARRDLLGVAGLLLRACLTYFVRAITRAVWRRIENVWRSRPASGRGSAFPRARLTYFVRAITRAVWRRIENVRRSRPAPGSRVLPSGPFDRLRSCHYPNSVATDRKRRRSRPAPGPRVCFSSGPFDTIACRAITACSVATDRNVWRSRPAPGSRVCFSAGRFSAGLLTGCRTARSPASPSPGRMYPLPSRPRSIPRRVDRPRRGARPAPARCPRAPRSATAAARHARPPPCRPVIE